MNWTRRHTIIFIAAASSIAVLAIILATMPCHASYSGLVIIPTADVLDDGTFDIEWQKDGKTPDDQRDCNIINSEFGYRHFIEIGADSDMSDEADHTPVLNAKFLIVKSADETNRIALGIYSIGKSMSATKYLVNTHNFKILRWHTGVARTDSENTRLFTGIDSRVFDKCSIMADYTQGNDNYSSIGLSYQINEPCSILIGSQFPNNGGGAVFTVHFIVGGSLKKIGY